MSPGRLLTEEVGPTAGPDQDQDRDLGAELAALAADVTPALEDVGFPAYVIDREGWIRWLNRAGIELVGDVRGRLVTSVVEPSQRATVRATIAKKLLGGSRTDFTTVLSLPDGTTSTVEVSSLPLRDGERVVGVFGMLFEVSRGRGAEASGYRLTPREQEVLTYLADGYSTDQMAEAMGLAKETVRNHVRRLFRALGVHSRVEAVALGRRVGLIG